MSVMPRGRSQLFVLLFAVLCFTGCQSVPSAPVPLAENVDLERFAGDWYVIGGSLTPFETGAQDAVERYVFRAPDVMETTFEFTASATGARKRYTPTGFVEPGTGNAVWGMQFLWPLRADYRILRLADDYSFTIVGRQARDYVWIMARSPEFSELRWEETIAWLAEIGYEPSTITRIPQSAAR